MGGGVLFGLVAYIDKNALQYVDPISLLFIFNIIGSMLFLFIPKTYKDLKPIIKKYKWKILTARLSAVTSFYLIIWSIQHGNISIVNTNYETIFLLSTAFAGIIFLGEKKNIPKKLAGSTLCILGIILLNFF